MRGKKDKYYSETLAAKAERELVVDNSKISRTVTGVKRSMIGANYQTTTVLYVSKQEDM